MGNWSWVMGNGLKFESDTGIGQKRAFFKGLPDTAPLSRLHQIFFISICNYNDNILTEAEWHLDTQQR